MRTEEFDAKMSDVLTRLESMQMRVREKAEPDSETIRDTFEQLAVALEELQVADQEVRSKTEQIAAAHQRYQDLFNFAPDVYIVTDKFGMIREANAAAAALFGVPTADLIGHPLANWLEESGRFEFRRLVNSLPTVEEIRDRDAQFFFRPQPAEPIDVAYSARVLRDRSKVIGLLWLIRDIRARKRAERELRAAQDTLRASEARFRLALEKAPVTVFSLNRDLKYTWVHYPTLGCAPEEMIGKTDAELLGGEDAARLTEIEANVLARGVGARGEVPLHDSSGALRYFDFTIEPLRDNDDAVVGLLGAYIDVTEQHRQREALERDKATLDRLVAERTQELATVNTRLRSLAQRTVSVQEDERARVSRELHDESGQGLTALKMALEAIRIDLPPELTDVCQRMDEAILLTRQTMEELRVLAHDLRPPALDAAGIGDVLEGLCHEFARRNHIPTEYHTSSLPDVSKLASVTLYRFTQEALTNIGKHAGATRVCVALEWEAERITLSVEDDGHGFDFPLAVAYTDERQGIGLVGLQERIKSIGGTLEIHSRPGQGTRLVADVPWKEAE